MTIQPESLHYLPSHEWVSVAEEGGAQVATIGISAFAVAELTDIVFLALPKTGQKLKAGEQFGEVESVKAVSNIYSPVSGEIVAANDGLVNTLEVLGQDPYNQGWMIKVRMDNPSDLGKLLNFEQYNKQCGNS